MINVDLLCKDTGFLVGFKIEGHANADVLGKDIICAAVSSAAYMTANMITDVLNVNATVKVIDSGAMYLEIDECDSSCCRDILLGFKVHMLGMEEQYPENIVVNYLEV